MITIVARSIVKENKTQEMITLARELVEASREEKGCISYEMYQDATNPLAFTMIEIWENIESLDEHKKTKHFERIVPQLNDCRVEKPVVHIYQKII